MENETEAQRTYRTQLTELIFYSKTVNSKTWLGFFFNYLKIMVTSSQQFSCSTVTVNCTVKKEKFESVNYLPQLFGLLANKKVYFNERYRS